MLAARFPSWEFILLELRVGHHTSQRFKNIIFASANKWFKTVIQAQDPNEVRLQREVLDRNQLLRFTHETRKREKSRVVANLWSQGIEFLEALRIVDEAFQDS